MAVPAATLAEGPLGKLGWHTINGLTLNVRNPGEWPRYKIEKMTGLRDRPDADDNRESNTGRPGEQPRPGNIRGKTVVVEGIIQALDPVSMMTAISEFESACRSNEPTVIHHAPPTARGGVEWDSFVRILGYTVDDDYSFNPHSIPSCWQTRFTLTWRMHHPFFFETTNPHSETDATSVTCVNGGTAPTEPKITIGHGAGAGVTITNATTGKLMKFDDLPGGDLIVVFIDRTAKVGSSSQLDKLDDALTTWWDEGADGLAPGSNTITQSGGDSLTVEWLDAA